MLDNKRNKPMLILISIPACEMEIRLGKKISAIPNIVKR